MTQPPQQPQAAPPQVERSRWAGGIPISGFIILGLGVLLLLQTTGVVPWRAWAEIWRFWPVALIAIGVNLVFGRRFPMLAGILVVVLLAAAVTGAAVYAASGPDLVTNTFREPIGELQSVDVHVDFGAGTLVVRSAAQGTEDLIGATFETPGRQADISLARAGEQGTLDISSEGGPFFGFGARANWDIALSPTPEVTLDVDGGAADVELDLSDLRVTGLDVSIGAANVDIVLPAAAGETQAVVSSGASNIEIDVPEGVAMRITSASGLSSVDVDTSRFPRLDDAWQSPDYDTATNRILLELRVGAANVDVR